MRENFERKLNENVRGKVNEKKKEVCSNFVDDISHSEGTKGRNYSQEEVESEISASSLPEIQTFFSPFALLISPTLFSHH